MNPEEKLTLNREEIQQQMTWAHVEQHESEEAWVTDQGKLTTKDLGRAHEEQHDESHEAHDQSEEAHKAITVQIKGKLTLKLSLEVLGKPTCHQNAHLGFGKVPIGVVILA